MAGIRSPSGFANLLPSMRFVVVRKRFESYAAGKHSRKQSTLCLQAGRQADSNECTGKVEPAGLHPSNGVATHYGTGSVLVHRIGGAGLGAAVGSGVGPVVLALLVQVRVCLFAGRTSPKRPGKSRSSEDVYQLASMLFAWNASRFNRINWHN